MEDIMRVKMELIEAGKWLYSKGLVSATDGNLSVRIDDRIVVTRSGVNKGKLSPEDFVIVGLDDCLRHEERRESCNPRSSSNTYGTDTCRYSF
ncbi:MAG: class II aldolase/adducin family protein [Deltaproteobacteria bacterium]|nr:class II aldolase/adducin family protein [Deltaproteobacteria bacterium]